MKKIVFKMDLEAGDTIPRWYLPVYKETTRCTYVCFHFIIAPYALIFQLVKNIFTNLWTDLICFNDDLKKFVLTKIRKIHKESNAKV